MKLRYVYGLAAAVWGVLVAAAVVIQVFGWVAGVSWLYLFGDDRWPDSASWYLIAIPLAAGVVAFVASVVVGYLQGRLWEASSRPDRARRRAYAMLFAGLGFWLTVGSAARLYHDRQESTRQASAAEETAFVRLSSGSRTIVSVESVTENGRYRVRVETAGARAGLYQLLWRLEDPLYRTALTTGDDRITLDEARPGFEVIFDRQAIAESYHEAILKSAAANVLVEQDFTLVLILEPVLRPEELAAIPPREVENLRRGFSHLRHQTRDQIAVRFRLLGGQLVD
jgi:F0F1-type ATP synthase membrane subunit c/vacuolar-type H+-ATPase subunit K